ncbi:hypothetical protein LJR219_001317 [Phenylobacterium sp. LjRoot219]|uniref:hypothetical protein n=1 Tax=Phenylobacterium sp. LjRoot219 TaxID=3342283 RepID=UPI003ECEEA9F
MRHIAILAAVAAALVAAPASAASVQISTAGKSAQQIRADVEKAAAEVCWQETRHDTLSYYTKAPCIRRTAREALQGLEQPLTTAQR